MINRDSEGTYDELTDRRSLTERMVGQKIETEPVIQQQTISAEPQKRQRLQALDVYRGLTMVGMILVDNMGPHAPWFLDHASWHGLTPADLIFPAFLFIMGMAIPLAVSQKKPIRLKNLIRILGLFAIGIFLNLLGKKFDFSIGKSDLTQ